VWFKRKLSYSRYVAVECLADGLAVVVQNGLDRASFSHVSFTRCEPEAQHHVLQQLVREHGLKGLPCSLVLSTDQYLSQTLERPNVEPSELAQAVRWKIRDYVEGDLSQWVVDSFPLPDAATRGRPQVVAVMARRTLIERMLGVVRASGLELDAIDIASLALRNLLALQEVDASQPQSVFWARDHEAIVLMCRDHDIYLARQVDADLAGLADPAQQEWVGQNLALEVQRSLDYFESQLRQRPPRFLHVLSNAHLDVLMRQLDSGLALDVRVLDVPGVELELAGDVALAAGAALRHVRLAGEQAA